MSRSKKSSRLAKVNNKSSVNKVVAITLITVVALAVLGALLLSTEMLAGKASFIRPGSLKGLGDFTVYRDDIKEGELLVRLEVPNKIMVGVPFMVDVYVSFSKLNVAGLTKIALTSSDKSVKFTGKIYDPNPVSLGTPWTMGNKPVSGGPGVLLVDQGSDKEHWNIQSRVNRGRYYLLGSLEMVADKPGSNFKISLSSSSEAHYFDPEDWDEIGCPIPTHGELLCLVGSGKGISQDVGNTLFKDLWSKGLIYKQKVLLGESIPKEKERSLENYVIKQAFTRIKRDTHCVPNSNPCGKKDCGIIDDGCGNAVDCSKGNKQFVIKKNAGAVCVDNVLTFK